MLPSSPQVRSVYSESGGIVSALRSLPPDQARATLCIDSTTLDVGVAREVSHDVHLLGAQMVDAPVSGGSFVDLVAYGKPHLIVHAVEGQA